MASAPLPPLSASVTRILALTGFSSELKTKDIQAAFSEYESMNGGFKIKWVDDTSLLLVFNDAGVGEPWLFTFLATHSRSVLLCKTLAAKRAYLQTILSPPASLAPSVGPSNIRIKPYDGADAQVCGTSQPQLGNQLHRKFLLTGSSTWRWYATGELCLHFRLLYTP